MNEIPAAQRLDLSSLARFDSASLVWVLERRRAARRQAAEQFGRDSVQHQAAITSIWNVVSTLQSRGVTVTS